MTLESVKPEEVGFDSGRLARVKPAMERFVDEGKLSGMVLLAARQGKVAYFESIGKMNVGKDIPMQNDAIFRIFSMTKPITCLAAMMLVEEGRMHLYDEVTEYLPFFAGVQVLEFDKYGKGVLANPRQPITLHHLFTHTAGFSYGFDPYNTIDQLYAREVWKQTEDDAEVSLEEFIRTAARMPLLFHPGEQWHYSIAHDVLALIVQIVSGQPFDQFLKTRIFEPLGMVDTGYNIPLEKASRLACNYQVGSEGKLRDIDPIEETIHLRPVIVPFGGHGLVSTAADYLRLCQMFLNEGELDGVRLVGRKTVEWMTMNHLPAGIHTDMPFAGYGLGFGVVTDQGIAPMIGTEGIYFWSGAAGTRFWIDPWEEVIGIFMVQINPEIPRAADFVFQNTVYQALID